MSATRCLVQESTSYKVTTGTAGLFRHAALVALLAALTTVAACGGGGSGDTGPVPPSNNWDQMNWDEGDWG